MKTSVSILVLLDVFLEAVSAATRVTTWLVSILVLLDVFLEDWRDNGVPPAIPCFNPCSLGCFPRSPSLRIVHPGGMVSILVLLDVFLEEDACPCCRRECTVSILVLLDVFLEVDLPPTQCFLLWEFQSLFSWMFSSKYVAIAERRLEKGFNPCSLGCFPRSCNAVGTGP